MNHLLRTTLLDAPFSSTIEYAADFFEEHPNLRVKAIASTTVPVETRCEVIDDPTDTARRHDALTLSWSPNSVLFPRFDGSFRVRPHFCGSIVELEGSYEPPGGFIGRVFDRIAGHVLASRTVENLLRRLRWYIENRYREYQAACPTIDQLNERARDVGAGAPGVRR